MAKKKLGNSSSFDVITEVKKTVEAADTKKQKDTKSSVKVKTVFPEKHSDYENMIRENVKNIKVDNDTCYKLDMIKAKRRSKQVLSTFDSLCYEAIREWLENNYETEMNS